MKVASIEVIPIRVPLLAPIVFAGGAQSSEERVIVKIYTDTGVTGIGESPSLPTWGPETQESVLAALRNYLAPVIVGEDPFSLERILERMDRALFGGTFAKSGIDMALYDIMGKALGIPIYQLLGGRYTDRLEVEYALTVKEPEEAAREARRAAVAGYKDFELKCSGDPEKDVEMVRLVRESIGDKHEIKVDVNQKYSVATAIRSIRKMEDYGIDFIEQPVPRWNLRGMAAIRRAIGTPLVIDEGAYTPEELMSAISTEAADGVHVKLEKAGGICRAKKMAAIAESAGLICIPNAPRCGIAAVAAHHLWTATRNLHGGVHGPREGFQDYVKKPMKEGMLYIEVPDTPGIGVDLDEARIEKYRISLYPT